MLEMSVFWWSIVNLTHINSFDTKLSHHRMVEVCTFRENMFISLTPRLCFESNPSLLFIYRVIWLVLRRIYWKTYSWGTKQLGEVINRVESQHLQLIGHKYRSSIEKRFQPFGILVARNLLPFVALIIYILHFWKPSLKKNVRTKCRYREIW